MYKKYPSKISYGLLIFTLIICFLPAFLSIKNTDVIEELLLKLLASGLPFGFILYLFLSNKYIIDENKNTLTVKMGFLINTKINISDIKSISKTNSIESAPASSLDRIRIKYGKSSDIIISPKDKLIFINHLLKINPNIVSDVV